MKLGITIFATDYAMRPDDLAKACEDRGFESVWFPEHTHIPTSLRTPPPIGTKIPRYLYHLHDLFVTLTAAAVVTKTIKLGSGICLVVEHDPILLAKQVASVDQLSRGRLLFGIGAGWNAEEMENHGTPFPRRWQVLRERIEAMKRIWTEEAAEYHGEFVNFAPIWCYPKPWQKPHPPILLGTLSTKGLHRVVQYCDGWIPTGVRMEDLAAAITSLHSRALQAGRQPGAVPVSIFGAVPEEAVLHRYHELGVERTVLTVPSREREHVLPLLDTYAALTTDGALGLTQAINARWPKSLRIRCWFHKMKNLEQKVPEQAWPAFKALVTDLRNAPSRHKAEERRAAIVARYQRECPQVCRGLLDAAAASLTPLAVPQRQQQYVCTSNLAERAFVEERRRTTVIPHLHDEHSLVQLVFAVLSRVSERWNTQSVSAVEHQPMRSLRRRLKLDDHEVKIGDSQSETPLRRSAASAA